MPRKPPTTPMMMALTLPSADQHIADAADIFAAIGIDAFAFEIADPPCAVLRYRHEGTGHGAAIMRTARLSRLSGRIRKAAARIVLVSVLATLRHSAGTPFCARAPTGKASDRARAASNLVFMKRSFRFGSPFPNRNGNSKFPFLGHVTEIRPSRSLIDRCRTHLPCA